MSTSLRARRGLPPYRPVQLWQGPAEEAAAGPEPTLHVPLRPDDLAPHYDLTLSHPAVDMPTFRAFERALAQAAVRRGLS